MTLQVSVPGHFMGMLRAFAGFGVALAVALGAVGCGDNDDDPADPASPTPTSTAGDEVTPTPQGNSTVMPGECEDDPLLDTVREEGTLRVIASLYLDNDVGDDRDSRRRAIAAVQDEVLAELEGSGAIMIRRYENLAALALEVDEAALCVLLVSDGVEHVNRDEADQPLEDSDVY